MRILLTGNIGCITAGWLGQTFPGCRVLLAGETGLKSSRKKGITVISPGNIDYDRLLEEDDLDYIIAFSNRLSFHTRERGEIERLSGLMEACRAHAPQRVIYLDGPALEEEDPLSQAARLLCRRLAGDTIQLQLVHCLYLYSAGWEKDYFHRMLSALERRGAFDFQEAPGQSACFMAMEDLSLLLQRMTDDWPGESGEAHVPDCFGHTFADLEAALKKVHPAWRFSYRTGGKISRVQADDRALRSRYGWFPRYSPLNELPAIEARYRQGKTPSLPLLARLSQTRSRHRKPLMLLELMLAAGLALLCGQLSNWQTQLALIDFRLLLVLLMASVYGMKMGLMAAAAASGLLLYAYQVQGMDWQTLFYHPANWVPFIVYFIVGAVCGYLRLIDRDKIRFMQEENEQLKEKLRFAQDMYQDVRQDKREYKKQIIGSKDSFGKIYHITQQLDVPLEREVFIQAVDILERNMENQSVALYSIAGEGRYGRLIAASSRIAAGLPASLALEKGGEMLSAVERGEVFANTRMAENMPMYAAGILHEGRLKILVMLKQASFDQMSLHYMNLFRILCGLIGSALRHTMEYQPALRETQCLPGTRILTEEYFEKALALERKMAEQRIARHLVVRLDGQGKTMQEMDHLLRQRVRFCDTAGIARDGQMYLILAQAAEQSLPVIINRLSQAGISCCRMEPEEMN